MSEHSSTSETPSGTHKAGLFDIRIIIGALIGIYGVILTVMGLVSSAAEKDKAAGVNINLWAGIVMVLIAAFFIGWARLRPIVVPDEVETEETPDGRPSTD